LNEAFYVPVSDQSSCVFYRQEKTWVYLWMLWCGPVTCLAHSILPKFITLIIFGECLLLFSPKYFVFPSYIKNLKI